MPQPVTMTTSAASAANGHPNLELECATLKLLEYCRDNDWAGFDPYDALNSALLTWVPFLNTKLPRLALTQLLKRSPVNIRSLLLVPKTQNPKALGLFLSALLRLSRIGVLSEKNAIPELIERIIALRSTGSPYWCWGYSFPWQTRTIIVPRSAPNLVCTVFTANALLDSFEQSRDARCLDMATSAAEYILKELYWNEGSEAAGFSYPSPELHVQVHNANFLAAALLSRVYKHTGERAFIEPALRVARYSARKQHSDGSWPYGESPTQTWIDNFHTGYNLCALQSLGQSLKSDEFDGVIRRGFDFYRHHFFRYDGAPKYFHNSTYPIDIHAVAQSIITLLEFKHLDESNVELAHSVSAWALNNMWDERGFFYYRVLRTVTIKTSYMRWSQAWMLLALSALVGETRARSNSRQSGHSTPSLARS